MDDVGLIMQDATKLIRAVPRQVFQLSQNALYTRCDLHLSILWLIRFLLFLVAAAFLLIDPDSSCHSPDRPCHISTTISFQTTFTVVVFTIGYDTLD